MGGEGAWKERRLPTLEFRCGGMSEGTEVAWAEVAWDGEDDEGLRISQKSLGFILFQSDTDCSPWGWIMEWASEEIDAWMNEIPGGPAWEEAVERETMTTKWKWKSMFMK